MVKQVFLRTVSSIRAEKPQSSDGKFYAVEAILTKVRGGFSFRAIHDALLSLSSQRRRSLVHRGNGVS